MKHSKSSRILLLRYLTGFYKRLPVLIALLFILNLLIMAGSFLNPYIYSIFINDVIVAQRLEEFPRVALCYTIVLLAMIGLRHMALTLQNKADNRIQYEMKGKFLSRLLFTGVSRLEELRIGEMKVGMEDDVNSLQEFVSKQIIGYYTNVIILVLSMVFLFTISWQLALVLLVLTPVIMLVDRLLSKREKRLVENNRVLESGITDWLNASFTNWAEIKSLRLNRYFKKRFLRMTHELILNSAHKLYFFAARYLIIPTIRDKLAIQVVIYSIGGLLVINGSLTIGALLIFAQYYTLMMNAIKTISLSNSDLVANQPIIDRVLAGLSFEDDRPRKQLPENPAELRLEQVSVIYPNGHQALEDVSFCIRAGERTVLYGESGSGKSTILKLLIGMLAPTKGRVMLSGCEIGEIAPDCLYRKVGVILQGAALFDLSIKENLRLAKVDAAAAEMEEACKKAFIWEDIQAMPQGLDTAIGENGSLLSGGQRQRLILARQLLMDNEILILDEATSNMDERSERLFYQALLQLGYQKTVILVNHNMRVLPGCDQYICVRHGTISIQQPENEEEIFDAINVKRDQRKNYRDSGS